MSVINVLILNLTTNSTETSNISISNNSQYKTAICSTVSIGQKGNYILFVLRWGALNMFSVASFCTLKLTSQPVRSCDTAQVSLLTWHTTGKTIFYSKHIQQRPGRYLCRLPLLRDPSYLPVSLCSTNHCDDGDSCVITIWLFLIVYDCW